MLCQTALGLDAAHQTSVSFFADKACGQSCGYATVALSQLMSPNKGLLVSTQFSWDPPTRDKSHQPQRPSPCWGLLAAVIARKSKLKNLQLGGKRAGDHIPTTAPLQSQPPNEGTWDGRVVDCGRGGGVGKGRGVGKGSGVPWTPLEKTRNPCESRGNAPYTKSIPSLL